ncbi:uncharacterized protein LOC125431395 [Sphaerodactylus townsendi]|uniref:Uncharacterized protein n=1 Tax=Sphaerodactylus townsendi TaxID=933632 RepID=A0ACB8FJW4_9SAUR|nr:uncharacterized protein LOC125431395 [Sphaerodactylus townsendi]
MFLALQKKLSQLPQSETRRFMLGEIFCHLSSAFPLFTAKDYTLWFGERLRLFLSSLDAQNLGFIPSGTSCDSLAAIVGALTNYHVNNTFENPGDVASFIKRVLHFQLQNSGSPCTQGVSADRQWLKTFFGPFSSSCSYTDFAELKSNFRGDDSLDLFSASALAQLSTQSRVIFSRLAIMHVYEAIQEKEDSFHHLGTFLDEFNNFALKNPGLLSNPKVQHRMLTFPAEMVFPQIDAMSPEDAAAWFQRLRPLLPGINGTLLDLLPRSMPCPYYQIVVKALVDVYSKLSAKKKEEVYGFQKTYLAAQFADSGSACDSGTTGVRGWLMDNLGDFCSVAKLNELQALYPGLNAIEDLSPVEAADLTLVGPMCSSGFTSVVVGRIKTFKEYQSLHDYLCRLRSLHCQGSGSAASAFTCNGSSPLASVAPEIQRELFSNILDFLRKQGPSMSASQWSDIAQFVQFEILPALNISYQPKPSASGPCGIFQAAATRDPKVSHWQEELQEVFEICSSVLPQTETTVTSHVCGSTIYPTSGNTTLNTGSVTTPDPESTITPTTGRAITRTTNRATTYIPSRPALFLYFPLIFWTFITISN